MRGHSRDRHRDIGRVKPSRSSAGIACRHPLQSGRHVRHAEPALVSLWAGHPPSLRKTACVKQYIIYCHWQVNRGLQG